MIIPISAIPVALMQHLSASHSLLSKEMVLNPTAFAQTTRSCLVFPFLSHSIQFHLYQSAIRPPFNYKFTDLFSSAARTWQDARERVLQTYRAWIRAVSILLPPRFVTSTSFISRGWKMFGLLTPTPSMEALGNSRKGGRFV